MRTRWSWGLVLAFVLSGSAAPPSLIAAEAAKAPAASAVVEQPSRMARFKSWCKKKFTRETDVARYGLELDANWAKADPERELVILIHGFNSTAQRNEALMLPVRAAGHPCGVFNYPNDDQLDRAAQLLSERLREFAKQHPERGIALLTHSAGGLVARACIEDPALDPGNVHKLVMIGPPTHGSVLARAAVGLDICEHCKMFGRGGFHASIADGMNEMREDLQPCSDFLTRLNAHERNDKVAYTILLGTGGKVQQWEMDSMRAALRKSTSRIPYVRDKVARLDPKLADLGEVIAGRGDGAVAIKRARLDGVPDTVLIGFSHLSVTGPPETDAIRKVHATVLDRLAK